MNEYRLYLHILSYLTKIRDAARSAYGGSMSVSFCHPRPMIVCTLAAALAFLSAAAQGQEPGQMPLSSDVWSADHEYVESSIRMAGFLAMAQGDAGRAECIDLHISSPMGVHYLTMALRALSERRAVFVIGATLEKRCPPSSDSSREAGKAIATERQFDDTQTHENVLQLIRGAGDMIGFVAIAKRNKPAAECLARLFASPRVVQEITKSAQDFPRFRVERIVYWAAKQECSFPAAGAAWDMVRPLPDRGAPGYGGRQERIRLAAAIAECERTQGAGARTCIAEWRQRRTAAFDQALDRAVQQSSARLQGIQQDADRLPDGRAIFKSDDGNWYFEDGSVVPAAAVEERVPRPKYSGTALLARTDQYANGFINGAIQMAGWQYRQTGAKTQGDCVLAGMWPENRLMADLRASIKAYPDALAVNLLHALLNRYCASSTVTSGDLSSATTVGRDFRSWTAAYRVSFYSAAIGMAAYLRLKLANDQAASDCILTGFMAGLSKSYPAFERAIADHPSDYVVDILHGQIVARCP